MNKVKGCPNENCEMNQKHKYFNKKHNYCSNCGSELLYVCKNKDCFTFLEESDGVYCLRCQAKIDDRNDSIKEKTKTALNAGVALGCAFAIRGKKLKKWGKSLIKK